MDRTAKITFAVMIAAMTAFAFFGVQIKDHGNKNVATIIYEATTK